MVTAHGPTVSFHVRGQWITYLARSYLRALAGFWGWLLEVQEAQVGNHGGQGLTQRGGASHLGTRLCPLPPGRASLQSLSLPLFVTCCSLLHWAGDTQGVRKEQKKSREGRKGMTEGRSMGPREIFQPLVAQAVSELPSSQGKRERSWGKVEAV